MTRSANELEMLVLKACRGVGLPLGQGQDVAKAVSKQPTADVLSQLTQVLTADIGPAMVFDAESASVSQAHVLRDLPTLADAVCNGCGPITVDGFCKSALADCLATHACVTLDQAQGGLALRACDAPMDDTPHRAAVSDEHWHALERLAARILVPETEETRLSGAGAGLNDND